jgi:hypothetical protein
MSNFMEKTLQHYGKVTAKKHSVQLQHTHCIKIGLAKIEQIARKEMNVLLNCNILYTCIKIGLGKIEQIARKEINVLHEKKLLDIKLSRTIIKLIVFL